MIVLNGIKLGIVLAFLIGPVFFAIIQTSVERGFLRGVLVSIGVSLSDILYVVICYVGFIHLIQDEAFHKQMGYVGGIILILFGLYHLFVKSRRSITTGKAATEKSGFRYLLKGFVINAFSPMVPLFWIGTLSIVAVDFGYTLTSDITIFYSAVLATVLLTDVAKAYLAGRLRRLITPRSMMWINVVVGIALIIFGIRLMVI